MANRPFQPVPNTPLVADPTGDAIWKRWLQNLQAFLGSAVRGPGSSTDNAVARWDGVTGTLLNNSGVIIDDSNNVSGIVNLTTTGNTILGDAAADTLTINAGTWTYGANWTATRAAGVLPAGTGNNILISAITAEGDSGGTTAVQGFVSRFDINGASNVAGVAAQRFVVVHAGTGIIAIARGNFLGVRVDAAGDITDARGNSSGFILTSTGDIVTGSCFSAETPTLSGSGVISNHYGFRSYNLGNASIPVVAAVKIDDITGSATISGVLSEISAGTGKKNINVTGTADNSLAGPLYLAKDGKTQQTATAQYAGSGAPNNANGNDGDFYFRSDGGVLTTIYQRRAGAWVGVV